MNRYLIVVLISAFLLLLTACPSQPTKGKYSDPGEAKSRSDRAMQELDRETK
jgi:starvation-inducible outer membrane lipoprotein